MRRVWAIGRIETIRHYNDTGFFILKYILIKEFKRIAISQLTS